MALSSFTVTIITKSNSPFNVIPNAPIEIRERLANGASGNLSLIFSDQAGLNPITQVGFAANSLGQATFFAAAADYNAVYDNNGTPVTIAVDVGVTGGILDERFDRLNPNTLAIWQADTTAKANDFVTTKERSTGNGGGGAGNVITGKLTANGTTKVAHGTLSLTWVMRDVEDYVGVLDSAQLIATDLVPGQKAETEFFKYVIKTAAQATTDGDFIDDLRNFTMNNGSVAVEESTTFNFSSENNIASHEFARKIRMREVANVNWYGDSNSERDTQLVQSSFKVAFFLPYGDLFVVGSVFDRATSGFTAEDCYKTFTTDNSADLAVIALGTNDGIFENMTSPLAGLKDYEKWMRLLIEREIIREKGVLIVTPLPVRFDKQFETYTQAAPTDPTPTEHRPDIAVYEGVCKRLAIEYGCALFDSREWSSQFADSRMANATNSIGDGIQFGDPIHIFTPYTASWGTSIAARVMCDNLIRPYSAVAGGAVQIRPNEDPFIAGVGFDATARYEYDASNAQHFATASGMGTPDWRALRLETGESIGYAFYVSQPMIIHPTFTAKAGSNYNLSLLVSTSAESYKQVDIDGQLDTKHGNNGNTSRSEAIAADTVFNKIDAVASFKILTPGWVLLTCKANTGNILWSGLEFESIDLFDYKTALVPANSFSVEADATDLDAEAVTRNIWVSNPLVQPVPGNTGWFIETLVRDTDTTLRMQRATTVSAGTTQKVSIRQFASGSWSAWFAAS